MNKVSYYLIQIINLAFAVCTFYFIKETFNLDDAAKLKKFLFLLPTVIGAAYVFFQNRILRMMLDSAYDDKH